MIVDIDSNNTHSIDISPPIATSMPYIYGPVMPYLGQLGALYFDNMNVIEFFRHWNIECEDFDLINTQRCIRISDYCIPETKDVIELLNRYKTNDWAKLQSKLKGLF